VLSGFTRIAVYAFSRGNKPCAFRYAICLISSSLKNLHWTEGKCSVEVWRSSPTDAVAKSDKPAVMAELNRTNQRWRFSDFVYPDLKTDVLNELEQTKKARMK